MKNTPTLKYVFVFSFLFLLNLNVFSQDLAEFNANRIDLTKNGMFVLGSWAAINMISSPILARQSSGSTKYFHQMNGYWNIINFGLAGASLYSAFTSDASGLTLAQSLSEQQSIEKILLFNAGLDVGYIATGFYLMERSKNSINNQDRLKGFGQSLILQGGFLLLFDSIFYGIQNHNGKVLHKLIETAYITPAGLGLTINL